MSLNRPVWKLKDWIDVEKLDWSLLSLNPNAIDFIINNNIKLDWSCLWRNCKSSRRNI